MNMTLEQILPALRARWLRVLLTFGVVTAVVLAVSLSLPARYESTATLVVEINGSDAIGGQAMFKPAGAVSTYIATQADILKSEDAARRALRSLGLHENPAWQAKWRDKTGGRTDLESWIAAALLRDLDVRPGRDSNVLNLSYVSSDAQFSAAVANAFVQSYIDATLQMRVEPARQFNRFFAERAQPLREALEAARARLSAYEKEAGVAVGEEADVESARLAELNSQLVALQDGATEAANLRKQAGAAPSGVAQVRNDPEVAALTGELVRQQGRLTELKSELGEQHQAVIQARQSLADLRRRMDASMRRAAESLSVPVRVTDARLGEVRAAIQRQRELVLRRKAQRDAAAPLLRDVDSAQKAYDAVLQRASQTALESANTTQTSVSVLKAATPVLWSPAFLVRNMIIAMLLGLLLGIARALLAEHRDRRLRSPADVFRRLRQPLLLALPSGAARRGAGRSEQTRQRLVRGRQAWLAAPKGASNP